jgi:diaminopimelate decarboxylase
MREFYYRDNILQCERISISQLVEQYGTPLYVYSKNSIIDHCRHIEKAFKDNDHLSCYAVKANSNREILKVIANEGLGADIGSIGELYLALNSGFQPDKITYSGVGKRDDEIDFALQNDILAFNIESLEELYVVHNIAQQKRTRARILLRVNLDIDARTHPYITTSMKHNKFGVASDQAARILSTANTLSNIEVLGVHVHIGSQIIDIDTFIQTAHTVTKLVADLRESGIPIKHLNFGGGFGVQYRDFVTHHSLKIEENVIESEISVSNFIEAIVPILSKTGCKILIQPGRSIMAHSGILVTRVLYRKRSVDRTFIIVDGGMNDLLRPALYQSYHQIVPVKIENTEHEVVDVVGPLCESGDYFALDRELPRVDRNDALVLMCVGAYGYVLASNYNARPRSAEIMVDGNNSFLIRERERLEVL